MVDDAVAPGREHGAALAAFDIPRDGGQAVIAEFSEIEGNAFAPAVSRCPPKLRARIFTAEEIDSFQNIVGMGRTIDVSDRIEDLASPGIGGGNICAA